MTIDTRNVAAITVAARVAGAFLTNPHSRMTAEDAKALVAAVHATVWELGGKASDKGAGDPFPAEEGEPTYARAVTVRKSLADPNFVISMIDGKPYRSLKRHLSSRGLTPADYRQRYALPADYPLIAPAYSMARSELSKRLGLGRKPSMPVEAPEKAATAPKGKRGRMTALEARKAAVAHLMGN